MKTPESENKDWTSGGPDGEAWRRAKTMTGHSNRKKTRAKEVTRIRGVDPYVAGSRSRLCRFPQVVKVKEGGQSQTQSTLIELLVCL